MPVVSYDTMLDHRGDSSDLDGRSLLSCSDGASFIGEILSSSLAMFLKFLGVERSCSGNRESNQNSSLVQNDGRGFSLGVNGCLHRSLQSAFPRFIAPCIPDRNPFRNH